MVCTICGNAHGPDDAHQLWSQRYRAQFVRRFGRLPTWADATAHCHPAVAALYQIALGRKRLWSEPHDWAIAQEPEYAPPAAIAAAETVVGR